MDRTLEIGTPPLKITLRRSARARRFSLRVSRADGAVVLSLPRWTPEREALGFALSQESGSARPCRPPRGGPAGAGVGDPAGG